MVNDGGAIFGWWFGELAALVPAPLRRPLRWNNDLVVLDLSGAELVVSREGDGAPREICRVALAEGDAKAPRRAPWTPARCSSARRWCA